MRASTTSLAALGLLTAGVGLASAQVATSVAYSKHNLSVSGPGQIRAESETRICVFCHTPHNASIQAPLWNRQSPAQIFQMYRSTTLDAYLADQGAPQPDGASKLCLSCHDGTIALGLTVTEGNIGMRGGITTMPEDSGSHLGQDLSGAHPISFRVTGALIDTNNAQGDVPLKSLTEMRNSPKALLDTRDKVQCTTCHDPHSDAYGNFLRTPVVGELCLACHL